jgi:hypothetical protein
MYFLTFLDCLLKADIALLACISLGAFYFLNKGNLLSDKILLKMGLNPFFLYFVGQSGSQIKYVAMKMSDTKPGREPEFAIRLGTLLKREISRGRLNSFADKIGCARTLARAEEWAFFMSILTIGK